MDIDEVKLYVEEHKSIYEIAELLNMSPVGVWKRLKKKGVSMQCGVKIGTKWAVKKRGLEYLGRDGRYWIRDYRTGKNIKTSERRAVVVMEGILGHTIPEGFVVHHKDENPINDEPDNLQLMTSAEHSKLHHLGIKNPKKASKTGKFKLTELQMIEIKTLYKTGQYSQSKLADLFNVHQTNISKIIRSVDIK